MLLLVCVVLLSTSCSRKQKKPNEVDGVDEHPIFLGHWYNITDLEIETFSFSPELEVFKNGTANYSGGMKYSAGEFGYKDDFIYIHSLAFEVIREPRKLYWMTDNSYDFREVKHITHVMRLEEYKRQVNFPSALHFDLIKNGYAELENPTSFFERDSSTIYGSNDAYTVAVQIGRDSATWISGWWATGMDTHLFEMGDAIGAYLDSNVLHFAKDGISYRFEKLDEGLFFGASLSDRDVLYDEPDGFFRDGLLQ